MHALQRRGSGFKLMCSECLAESIGVLRNIELNCKFNLDSECGARHRRQLPLESPVLAQTAQQGLDMEVLARSAEGALPVQWP